jgi:hypothetical protein
MTSRPPPTTGKAVTGAGLAGAHEPWCRALTERTEGSSTDVGAAKAEATRGRAKKMEENRILLVGK